MCEKNTNKKFLEIKPVSFPYHNGNKYKKKHTFLMSEPAAMATTTKRMMTLDLNCFMYLKQCDVGKWWVT